MAAGSHAAAQLRRLEAMPCPGGVRIGIVGGGLMGIALARRLASAGHQVAVLERDRQPGGLATWHDYGTFFWDRFYHVILPSDSHLIDFVGDLELSDALQWRRTYTGFYVDKRLHSISNNYEFLRFPLLSMFSKARLAWTMLYASRIDDWRRLEKVTVEDWLIRVSGRATYEKMWKPLLLAKLGDNYKRVSAVFIWSYIKRLFSARHSAASKEQLGHVVGGYKAIFERACAQIEEAGGRVVTGVGVESIEPGEGQGMLVRTDAGVEKFDRVVCTTPVPLLRKLTHPSLLTVTEGAGDVEYLGVICVVLVTSEPLVPYYVVNIADGDIPFTGVIGMTNVVSREQTAGLHLTYLPKYLLSTHPLFQRTDREIEELFISGVCRMFPGFDLGRIESIHVNRAARVQPLQVMDYSSLVPTITTEHPDFFVLNTAQFVNATLNNNEVIGAVNRFCERHGSSLMRPAAAAVQA
jgi:protoporphyrinogen oxidase